MGGTEMKLKSILPLILPTAFMLLLAGCGGGSEPLPDIDAAVEARVAEEGAAEATVEAKAKA